MSGIPNEELVRKAAILLDTLSSSGKLSPKQANKFIDYVIDETMLKNNARIERFTNETLDIDKIGIGRRAAVPHTEAQDPGIRRGVATSKVTLTPKSIMVPIEISSLFLQRSIEGANVEDHIVKMFAKQFGNDWEEFLINGDTLGAATLESDYVAGGDATKYRKDSYLGLSDGWIKLADGGNSYDALGANIGLSVFSGMLRAMPTKFRRNKRDLRWFMSSDLAQLYTEKLSTRATPLGDRSAEGASHSPFGIKIVEVPLWSFLPRVVKHVVLTGTTAASLGYAPVSSVIVSTSTLDTTPETAYTETTDYVVNYSTGTVVRSGGGSAIGSGNTVKVTFNTNPQLILTHQQNFIVGINTNLTVGKDYDIYKRVAQYAWHASVACEFEEDTALVKAINVGQTV